MVYDTAGDPMGSLRWTRKTTEKVSQELRKAGINVSPKTVSRLLQDMDYSLRVNHKKRAAHGSHPDRNSQFEYIATMRRSFERAGLPIVSVDTKKKEMIGNFKNPGAAWSKKPIEANDHDFKRDSTGTFIPRGHFDLLANRGDVVAGISHDTPAFAVDALALWWQRHGQRRYPGATKLLVLADGGGSNSYRSRVWKHRLQGLLCSPFRLKVTVCHYPPGTSKWNPVEHRLFSMITKNWGARPLDSFETALKFLRTTRTKTGLRVTATLNRRQYKIGVKVSKSEFAAIHLQRHETCPSWNYTILPRAGGPKM
jgi:hypothetical protein